MSSCLQNCRPGDKVEYKSGAIYIVKSISQFAGYSVLVANIDGEVVGSLGEHHMPFIRRIVKKTKFSK